MRPDGIIISGASGAGKSTIAQKIVELIPDSVIVQSTTTRSKRDDEEDLFYSFVTQKNFVELRKDKKLLTDITYRNSSYAIERKTVDDILAANRIPILIVSPDSIDKILSVENYSHFSSFFLDASDDELNRRLLARDGNVDEDVKIQREQDRLLIPSYHYYLLNITIDSTCELVKTLARFYNIGGVIPERIIRLMIECGLLIQEYSDIKNISGASYDMTLGDEYSYGGDICNLTDGDPFIHIEAYDCAIVCSKEKFAFPRDISARFDLSVGLFCQGIILSNGPQVDPGFHGPLFCLLFNTSNQRISLKKGQHYATIEFHKLLESTQPYKGQYQNKEKIMQYLPHQPVKGAGSEIRESLEKVREEAELLRNANKHHNEAILITVILGLIAFAESMFLLLLST